MLDLSSARERLGDLTSRERELVDAAASGDALECSQLSIEQLSATDDPEHTIRAELLRELLLKRCDKPPDPRGVRLRGARITGTLDLTHVEATIGMELKSCNFEHLVLLKNAHLPWLTLAGSCVPALHGNGLQIDGDLSLQGLQATGHGENGAVQLLGAHVAGELSLRGAELINKTGPALVADRLRVDGGLFLHEGFRATGYGEDGAVQLADAHITGELALLGAKLINKTGPALAANQLQVDGDLSLEGLQATGHGKDGAVQLMGAHVTGWLFLSDAVLTNDAGPALDGNRLQVDRDVFLHKLQATGHGENGAVQLMGAHVTGWLSLMDAKLINKTGPALDAYRLQVGGDASLQGLQATGHGKNGTVRLLGAHVTGTLLLSDAALTNDTGPALAAIRLQVGGDVSLNGLQATGHGKDGAVRLAGAHVTGTLFLSDAALTNDTGPALAAIRLQVGGDVSLDRLQATGHDENGTVQLAGTHVTGWLSLVDAKLTNEDGLVLDLEYAETKTIFLSPHVICPQGVAGRSICDATARGVDLSDFVYTSLERSSWDQWLHLITWHTDGYQPQPYQKLAAVQRAKGHDADVRKILIAQQQDLRERGDIGGWLPRTVHRAWGALGGYGYRTLRTALALLIVLLAAAGLGIAAGHIPTSPGRYVAMHTAQADDPHGPCTLTEQIGVGIDRGLPLGTTGIRGRCDFDTTSRRGQAVTWATWGLQFFVWALATLFAAGYVGLIRKAT